MLDVEVTSDKFICPSYIVLCKAETMVARVRTRAVCIAAFVSALSFSAPLSAQDLTNIRERSYKAVTSLVSTEYRGELTSSTGQVSSLRFLRNGDHYRLEREDRSAPVINGRQIPPVNAVWTYDGQRFQRFNVERDRLRLSDNEHRIGATDPMLRIYCWLLQGLCEMPTWQTLQDQSVWNRRFENASFLGETTINGERCWLTEFPQDCISNPCVYQVAFTADEFCLPIHVERRVKSSGEVSTTVTVDQRKHFEVVDASVLFPLKVTSIETAADGLSYAQTMTWTLVEDQINLDAEIDPSVFTLSPAGSTRIHDVQQNRKAIEAVRPAAAQVEPVDSERRWLRYLFVMLNLADAAVLLRLVWKNRDRSGVST